MFKKGQSGNPNGRPKGALNKETKNYLDIQAFAKLIWEGMEEAGYKGEKKIAVAFRALELMFQKIQNLPGVPRDSVLNAQETMEMLKRLEQDPPPKIEEPVNV